ncbi:DUF5658 family protein [Nitrosomonas aestuarii]|uniref:DUF5658 domain-containing protein n=1 Tax=Nitrosomonas aestuarii TaxID=52441 RepID=A0A1I4CDI6_9PROT|nr:DUF5658 family protein [Nitrosomonas aestuarii]PTN12119.1 hypothetical protein C8R11_10580 [Nitrosomonas aestuarii]SFK78995.1 hypothetical protein SAMN05216302_101556 [Nitrosomonas aestuarii]
MAITYDLRVQDRRREVPFFCAYHLGIKQGRRMDERRSSEGRWNAAYVDLYTDRLMLCVVGILVLSICDAVFTLKILAQGGDELNWFMAILIDDSVEKFIAVKMALTSLALIMLVIHHNVKVFYKMRVRHLKYMLLSGYGFLIGYELYLLELVSGV